LAITFPAHLRVQNPRVPARGTDNFRGLASAPTAASKNAYLYSNVMSHYVKYIIIFGLLISSFSCENRSTTNLEELSEEKESYYSDTILSYSTGNFPNDWDINRNLRETDKQVLIWKHIKDERGKEFKFCITFREKLDSAGNEKMFIEEMRSEFPNFEEWQTAAKKIQ